MKGLDTEEIEQFKFSLESNCPNHDEDNLGTDESPEDAAICDRLVARGLMISVDCDCGTWEIWQITPLGRLALRLATASELVT